jgi:hypothetical protein
VVDNLEEGLVGYWHFDEGTGHATTTDASGYGNTGTLTNDPTWTSGASCKSRNCLSFDGTDDYISIIAQDYFKANTTRPFTFSAWVNGEYDSDDGIFNLGSTKLNFWVQSNLLIYRRNSQTSSYSFGWNNDTWHFVVIADNGTNQSMYIDGAYVKGSSLTGNPDYGSSNFEIGREIFGDNRYNWNGIIDEVRIYNRALSATEVLKLYNDFK